MTIEWDDQKNIENKQKHGINFETASVCLQIYFE